MAAAEDAAAINIALEAFKREGSPLHAAVSSLPGVLTMLTTEQHSCQQAHFARLLPSVQPVSALAGSTTQASCGCDWPTHGQLLCAAHLWQGKLRLLFRGSEHSMTPEAFWQRCGNKANALTVIKVSTI